MAGVNLAEDGQSMTREFLNGRLCKRGNNLQPRSKGARVADVTGFLPDFVHRNGYSISNPIKEKRILRIIGEHDLIGDYLSIARMESSRNRDKIIVRGEIQSWRERRRRIVESISLKTEFLIFRSLRSYRYEI